ncbi:MAG: hypothetical protein KAW92_07150 [Candidatus Cloacimonetes bacterium]|nr:hypothetical protein [Candidatus Cloacimonadota bacterium]
MDKDKLKNIWKEIDTKTMWVMGEREWSSELAGKVLKKEHDLLNNETKNKFDGETGIFLIKDLNNKSYKFFNNCVKLYFFNSEKQLYCVYANGNEYYFVESSLDKNNNEIIKFQNIKGNTSRQYRFSFSSRIGAIPDNLKKTDIMIIRNNKTGMWRFYHE